MRLLLTICSLYHPAIIILPLSVLDLSTLRRKKPGQSSEYWQDSDEYLVKRSGGSTRRMHQILSVCSTCTAFVGGTSGQDTPKARFHHGQEAVAIFLQVCSEDNEKPDFRWTLHSSDTSLLQTKIQAFAMSASWIGNVKDHLWFSSEIALRVVI